MTYTKFTGLFIRICIKFGCQVQGNAVESEEKKEKSVSKKKIGCHRHRWSLVGWAEVRNVQMAWEWWNNCSWLTLKTQIKSCSSVMWGCLFEGRTFLAGYSVEQCLANKPKTKQQQKKCPEVKISKHTEKEGKKGSNTVKLPKDPLKYWSAKSFSMFSTVSSNYLQTLYSSLNNHSHPSSLKLHESKRNGYWEGTDKTVSLPFTEGMKSGSRSSSLD